MLHDMQDVLQRFPTPPPTKEKEKLILRSAEPYRRQPLILVDCTDSWERTKSGGAVGPRHAALNLSAEVLTQRSESSPARRHRRYTEAERALEQSLHALASSGSPDRALHATASLLRALSESSGEAARQIRALIASSDLHGSALQAAKRERWVWEMRQRQASEQLAKLPQAPAAPSADRRQRNLARFLESSEHKLAIRPTARLKRRSLQSRKMVAADAEMMMVRERVPLPPPGVFLEELTTRRPRCNKSKTRSEASASVTTLPTASSSSLLTEQHDEDSALRAFAASCALSGREYDDEREVARGSVVVYHTPKRTHRSRQSIYRDLDDLPLPDYARELLEGFSEGPSVELPSLDLSSDFDRPRHASMPPLPRVAQEPHPFPLVSPPRAPASQPDARRRTQSSTPVKGHRTFLSLENASPARFLSLRSSERPRRQKLRSLFSIAESQSADRDLRTGSPSDLQKAGGSSTASVSTADALPERMSSEDVRLSSDWTLLRAASRSEMFDSTDRRLRRKPSIASRLAKRVSLQLARGSYIGGSSPV